MATEILSVSDRLLAAVLNGIYQGALITVLVALSLRVLRRTNAATRHAVWLCTLVLLALLVAAHCFFQVRPPALQPVKIARTAATLEQEIGKPERGVVAETAIGMPTEFTSSGPEWPGDLPAEQDRRASPNPDSSGRVLPQPPPWWRRSSPAPPSKEERVGERRSTLLNAPLPNPLPTRSSRGEGERWSHRDAPDSLSLTATELPNEVQPFSAGNSPLPDTTLSGGELSRPSSTEVPLTTSAAADQSAGLYAAIRRLANPVSLKLGLESRTARIVGGILLSICLMLSGARLFMLLLRLHQIRKLKRQSFPASEALNELFQGLVARLGTRRNVALKTLPASQSSFVLGFLHPVILLPAEQMELTEAEPILRHELAHVRRHDDWANLLQHFILAAFPFHPAVWWISKRLSLEREIACDDYVLQSSAHPRAYALLLANLAARMQRCPPLLAPGASNNKTQLQQRIDMILNKRRNTSPRLATASLTFMASAAALSAVAAVCLAPRIVLAQGDAAPAAASNPGSVIDDPPGPAVASAAVNFSAGADESPATALPATPRPAAIGPGPKLKPGHSWPVPGQPPVAPAPTTPAVPVAAAGLAVPAPLTAQSALPVAPGSILLSAAPESEPRPGRTPWPARVESADSTLEERLERLEKMVESLMARGDANRKPYHLKPSADLARPMDRKEIAETQARHQAELELMNAEEIERIKEQAKRQAARSADQAKRAAGDAEKIAKDQKRKIKRDSKEGAQRQLDDLRKQLENLEREREKLELQIEQLERSQEQQEQQQDENQDNDAQSDASEVNSDSTPRQ